MDGPPRWSGHLARADRASNIRETTARSGARTDERTPAARHPEIIKRLQKEGQLPTLLFSPPNEDFSRPNDDAAPSSPSPATTTAENPSPTTACDHAPSPTSSPSSAQCAPSQPLLTPPIPQPIAELQITPDQPGARVTQGPPPSSLPTFEP